MHRCAAWAVALALTLAGGASAADPAPEPISLAQALARARRSAPELGVALGGEGVARAEIDVATTYPNPNVSVGTTTRTARLTADLSVPFVIFGQRGAARSAASADLATARADTAATWLDVRAATAHAFVKLWLAQETAIGRRQIATLVARLDDGVAERARAGTAPEIDALRAHSERLRAEADAVQAERLIPAAAADLGRWLGELDGSGLRANGEPPMPSAHTLASLRTKIEDNAELERERRAERAALAHADAERAAALPVVSLELGVEAYDPTLQGTNYRAGLGFELPLFSQRGALADRARASAALARSRQSAIRVRLLADLVSAYRRAEALGTRVTVLRDSIVPASERAASALEDVYTLGRVPLSSVLDAEQSRIAARLDLLEARAALADAWIDVERAAGVTS